jgi:NAD(P)-dependent dehydrogenase (short-subunit alcohol dehydrogenase family)
VNERKTVLVTGATDGIGRATALALARAGLRVLVHGRSASRAEAVLRELPGAGHEPVLGDLASLADVRRLAAEVAGKAPVLDVLLHNAGVFEKTRVLTVDGLERTFAVNHLAPFLLTELLLPNVVAARQGRIVTVSSVAHQRAALDLGDIGFERAPYEGYAAYARSKLANVLFAFELARRLAGTNAPHVTSNALHPGVITTKLLRAGFGMDGASVEDGAQTSVFLATSPEVASVTGTYFADSRPAKASALANDPRLGADLFALSAKLVSGS